LLGEAALEQERDVADDDPVTTAPSVVDELVAQTLDLRMHDGIEGLELLAVRENPLAELAAVDQPVGRGHSFTPPLDDRMIGGHADVHGLAREDVRIDHRCTPAAEQLRYGGFSAGDVAGEPDK
jgi:hypothetical protein